MDIDELGTHLIPNDIHVLDQTSFSEKDVFKAIKVLGQNFLR